MTEYDGSVRIGVKLDLENAEKQVKHLKNRMAGQVKEIGKQAQAVNKLKAEYDKLLGETAEPKTIRAIADNISKTKEETKLLEEELTRLSSLEPGEVSQETIQQMQALKEQIATADERTDRLKQDLIELSVSPEMMDKVEEMATRLRNADSELEQMRASAGQTKTEIEATGQKIDQFNGYLRDIRENAEVSDQGIIDMTNRLEELKKHLADLEAAGLSIGFKDYDETVAEIQNIGEELRQYKRSLGEANEAGEKASWLSKLGSAMKRIASVIGKTTKSAGNAIEKLKKRISSLGREKGFNKAANGVRRFSTRLKSIVAGAFVFNVLSRGLNELTSKIRDYLKADKNFSDSLDHIKSNLLTAFQPIYDAIIPALNMLMSAIERITAQFAAFTAQIFGTTAKKAQEDAKALKEKADALKESGDAAKEAEKEEKKYLASFDTVEKLGENEEKKEEKKEDEPAFDTDFSEIEPPKWLMDFWAPIKESWDQVGGATIEAVKSALGSIWDLLKAIGKTFLDMWNSAIGVETLNNLQLLLQTILGIIHDIATAFMTAWNSGTGEEVIAALFYMINSVLELLISVGQAFREAWNDDGRGVEIYNTILQIIRNIFNIVGNLANRFQEAWEANDNGVRIWGAILDIIQDVLDFFQEITLATVHWTDGLNLEPIVSAFRALLEAVEPLVDTILGGLSWAWENILLPLAGWVIEEAAPAAVDVLTEAFKALNKILEALAPVFMALWNNILKPLASFIGSVFIMALNALGAAIEWIGDLLTGLIQTLSDAASQVAGFFGASGSTKTSGMNSAGGSRAYSPRMASFAGEISAYSLNDLPHLAQGAVISPNSEFLAVLGDQRSGTNVEAPLSAIEQALENVFARHGGAAGGNTQVNINFTGTLAQLARVLQPVITVENGRLGHSLA